MKNGTRSCAATTNMRQTWRTWPRRSISGPTMKPGVSISETSGSPCASQSCMKRAALSAASASIAPPRWDGSLARTPTGRPSMRASAVTMPAPKSRRSSSTESAVGERARSPDARRRRAGDSPAAASRSAVWSPRVQAAPRGPWKKREVRRAAATASASSCDEHVDHAVLATGRRSGRSPRAGTCRGRRLRSSPGRPCRCELSAVAMMTSQQPSSAALPAKQRPAAMPTRGTWPLRAREAGEGRHVQAGDDRHVDVAGPAAAALGEQHHRQALCARDGEQAVDLLVVAHALRAGEDGVVVGQHHGARALGAEALARRCCRCP